MIENQDNYNVGLVIKKDKERIHKIKVDENQIVKKKKKKLHEIFDFKSNRKKNKLKKKN